MRSTLIWNFTPRVMEVLYRRFGTNFEELTATRFVKVRYCYVMKVLSEVFKTPVFVHASTYTQSESLNLN